MEASGPHVTGRSRPEAETTPCEEFQISTVLPSTNPTRSSPTTLRLARDQVLRLSWRLHLQLERPTRCALNPQRVAAGVKAMLENPALCHIVIAWRNSDHRVIGQLEVKKPFEFGTTLRY